MKKEIKVMCASYYLPLSTLSPSLFLSMLPWPQTRPLIVLSMEANILISVAFVIKPKFCNFFPDHFDKESILLKESKLTFK